MGDNGGPSAALTPERGSTTSGAEHDEVASTAKTDTRSHHSESHDVAQPGEDASESDGGTPPPLPPRPKPAHSTTESPSSPSNTLRVSSLSSRPQLRTTATTALSLTDIQTQTYQDGARETYPISSQAASGTSRGYASPGSISHGRIFGHSASEMGETSSLRSYVPTLEATGDVESLMGEALGTGATGPAWNLVGGPDRTRDQFEDSDGDDSDQDFREKFHHEFDGVQQRTEDENDEEAQLQQWRSRLKHFLILSSAGKPIYSRHGDQKLISSYMGVVQTIISFYQGAQDPLRAFSAGGVRFVILTEGPLYLVAISRLDESDTQLRVQLEALYMQVLSTLTLPVLTNLFSNRPSTDLRRPLQGTEPLLSALADSFTKGSPSTLLSALECLKLRKAHRQRINQALLNARTPDLLYGLLVAGGRLVSVVRPKRHSLHPGDLQLIFNMLFAAGGVKAGGGENWIPLCLPGFNKDGYLYMYVGFLGDNQDEGKGEEKTTLSSSSLEKEDHVAILLISPKKEGFYEMKKMRDQVVGYSAADPARRTYSQGQ
ncbi:MAG: Vacuolar fusion protein mon1 [Thelocarpon superellum]|nr:MAG: Vacuolar fusion protein mon1 [Thelocarpon superellum]